MSKMSNMANSKRFHSADLATLDNSVRAAWFPETAGHQQFPLSAGLFVSAKLKKQLSRTIHKQDSLLGNRQASEFKGLNKQQQQELAASAVSNGFNVAFLPFSKQSFLFPEGETK